MPLPVDPAHDQPCQIVIVSALASEPRTLHVDVGAVASCDSLSCAASCSSPELPLVGFPACSRSKKGGQLWVDTDSTGAAAIGKYLGATSSRGTVSGSVRCGGVEVWSGTLFACQVPL